MGKLQKYVVLAVIFALVAECRELKEDKQTSDFGNLGVNGGGGGTDSTPLQGGGVSVNASDCVGFGGIGGFSAFGGGRPRGGGPGGFGGGGFGGGPGVFEGFWR